MGTKLKLLFSIPLLALTLYSCKEEEPVVDKCKNNYLDPGEDKVDCGGNCPDCPVEYLPLLYAKVNGVQTSFDNKNLQKTNDDWVLTCSNDTCNFVFYLGDNSTVGTYNLQQQGTYIFFQSIQYPNVTNGTYTIGSHDPSARRMSGFFQGKFSRANFADTIYITAGQFSDLKY